MTDTPAAGALIARGEDADVFAIDETCVLRRYRRQAVPEREVAIDAILHLAGCDPAGGMKPRQEKPSSSGPAGTVRGR